VASRDLAAIAEAVSPLSAAEVIRVLERLGATQRALVFRMLPKDTALAVFEGLDRPVQGDLVRALRDEDVAAVFAGMSPDDRVGLLDELPASVATRLLRGLSASEQELTAAVLGYPVKSIGRRMSPKFVTVRPDDSAG
jgi:magnesium transporter